MVVGVLSAADAAEPDDPWLRIRFIGFERLPGERRPGVGDRSVVAGAGFDAAPEAGLFLDILVVR